MYSQVWTVIAKLNHFSTLPTPKLSPKDRLSLLLPHRSLTRTCTRDPSPPRAPKGHPIDDKNFFDPRVSPTPRNLVANNVQRIYPISNPYVSGKNSYTSTLTYLFRIPRRLRPVLLIGFCVFVFGLVYLNQAVYEVPESLEIPESLGQDVARVQFHAPVSRTLQFQDKTEELAALISVSEPCQNSTLTPQFITSTTANSLGEIDPTLPLDPLSILDFDPSRSDARDDLDLLIEHIHTVYPIVLYGKMRDPWHREIQKMLAGVPYHPDSTRC